MRTMKKSLLTMTALLLANFSQGETVVSGDASSVTIDSDIGYVEFVEIAGPHNLHLRSESLTITRDRDLPDGQYSFEISANTGYSSDDTENNINNGRDNSQKPGERTSVVYSGFFILANGKVVDISAEKNQGIKR
ncbi:Uncharacterised protein [BD1-7 clade bacterium]|nr:Uncharacterised protein [BD1-7 clade bacterium]